MQPPLVRWSGRALAAGGALTFLINAGLTPFLRRGAPFAEVADEEDLGPFVRHEERAAEESHGEGRSAEAPCAPRLSKVEPHGAEEEQDARDARETLAPQEDRRRRDLGERGPPRKERR